MPADLITNVLVSTAGSVALLLNPVEHKPEAATTKAPPDSTIEGKLLGDWGGVRRKWSDQGFDFTIQYFGEVAGNVSGGIKRGTVYNGLLNIANDVNLEKVVGWNGGSFHEAMLIPHGRSLTDDYVNDLFITSNLDASDNVHFFELWIEQNFAGDRFSFRAGQMAVDQEFAFTDQGALFCNSTFGWFPIVGATAPVYPQGAPGIRFKWNTCENSYVQVAFMDGDVNPANANGHETNPHGTRFKLEDGAFIVAEAGYKWKQHNKPGSFKLGGWYHSADHDDVRIDDGGLSLADPLSSGNPRQLIGNLGIYLTGEQTVWNEPSENGESSQGMGIYSRLGWEPSDRNTLELYAELGMTYTGLLPGRDDDLCGFGMAYGQMSTDLRRLGRDANGFDGTSNPIPDYEMVLEFDYQYQLRQGWKLQPGAQFIIHPGGSAATDNAFILSLRSIITF